MIKLEVGENVFLFLEVKLDNKIEMKPYLNPLAKQWVRCGDIGYIEGRIVYTIINIFKNKEITHVIPEKALNRDYILYMNDNCRISDLSKIVKPGYNLEDYMKENIINECE